jgi:ribosomal-protein-alanine N-acetyltransferase
MSEVLERSKQQAAATTKPFTIEWMKEEDLKEVVEIEEISGLNRWGYDAYRRELLKNPNSIMLVARYAVRDTYTAEPISARNVVGFLAGWTVVDELHVNNIAAHPDFRRMGIGSQLLEAAIEEGKRRGAAFAMLEVRASNFSAQSLYKKLGFKYVGRRPDYYRSPTEDAIVMKLELT